MITGVWEDTYIIFDINSLLIFGKFKSLSPVQAVHKAHKQQFMRARDNLAHLWFRQLSFAISEQA